MFLLQKSSKMLQTFGDIPGYILHDWPTNLKQSQQLDGKELHMTI